jgi:hypothetical protein
MGVALTHKCAIITHDIDSGHSGSDRKPDHSDVLLGQHHTTSEHSR